jgi:hypothetical protein
MNAPLINQDLSGNTNVPMEIVNETGSSPSAPSRLTAVQWIWHVERAQL